MKTYLDGLKKAHEIALGTLPFPGCGNRKKLLELGNILAIPIKAIEAEILKEDPKAFKKK